MTTISPYELQLTQYKSNPLAFVNQHTAKINQVMSQLLEEIDWDTDGLCQNGEKYQYFQFFKEYVTELTFIPYYYTHANFRTILPKIIAVYAKCPKVYSLHTKEGTYSSDKTTGLLFWKKPIYNELETYYFFQKLLAPGTYLGKKPSLCELKFPGTHYLSVSIFSTITTILPHLTTLEVSVSEGDQKTFNEAVARLNQLVHLTLNSKNLSNDNVNALATNCKKLVTLNIPQSQQLNLVGINHIGFMANLETLSLGKLPRYKNKNMFLLRRHKQLTSLTLRQTHPMAKLKDPASFLKTISDNTSNGLLTLNLDGNYFSFTQVEIGYFGKFSRLRVLSLNCIKPVPSKDAVVQLAQALPSLVHLEMKQWHLTAKHVFDFAKFKELKFLRIGCFPRCQELAESIVQLLTENPDLDAQIES